jgi:hypothetical protein
LHYGTAPPDRSDEERAMTRNDGGLLGRLGATLEQLAWYMERDGGRVIRFEADGAQVIEVPVMGGRITYRVPAADVADLNTQRDRVYRTLREKARKAAAR